MDENTYQAILAFMQVGGQYMIPAAALLRALYAGIRGKTTEGFFQILAASVLTGITAVVDGQDPDIQGIILELIGNSVFMSGLLSFVVLYLLNQHDARQWIDGIVGAIVGLAVWVVWSIILGNGWPWWAVPLAVIAGAGSFIVLRMLLRQIARLVSIATFLLRVGFFLLIAAGLVLAYQAVTGWLATNPIG